jgi:hypothetical protein
MVLRDKTMSLGMLVLLGKSCMADDMCQPYFDIYKNQRCVQSF